MAKILLVDDEPALIKTFSKAIAGRGHTVVTAKNGIEALNTFAKHAFDLVVTDIVMPDGEGLELIMELRRRSPDIKIVAMSGGGSKGYLEFLKMAQKLGATATLQKPARMAELYAVLDECLGDAR